MEVQSLDCKTDNLEVMCWGRSSGTEYLSTWEKCSLFLGRRCEGSKSLGFPWFPLMKTLTDVEGKSGGPLALFLAKQTAEQQDSAG